MNKANNLANDFQEKYSQDDLPALFTSLDEQGRQIFSQFLDGIESYRAHPYKRNVPPQPICWQEGTTTLKGHGGDMQKNASPVLIIPSLVNKSYILDLTEKQSFCRYLQSTGHQAFLVDWGYPNDDERKFALEDYILRLERAAEFLSEEFGAVPQIIGYCMGGTLAAGLAAYKPNLVSKLVLLASPWDFEADGGKQKQLLTPGLPIMKKQIEHYGQLPTDSLQLCFGLLDSMLALKKFTRFAKMKQDSQKAINFVALEDWLNDGVPLAGPTASECLEDWYQDNKPAHGKWVVKGKALLPCNIKCPSLCIIPEADRIVPPESAKALFDILPNATLLSPSLGHIGMMSSKRAVNSVWEPINRFLKLSFS